MGKNVFETQEFLRLIQDDEDKRTEFLGHIIKTEGVIRIDMRDVNRVLSCDGQMVIITTEADNFETALDNLLTGWGWTFSGTFPRTAPARR